MPLTLRTVTVFAASALALGLASCGGEDDGNDRSAQQGNRPALLPEGGKAPPRELEELGEAARAAQCKVQSVAAGSRDHTTALEEPVQYKTNPPTAGRHFQEAAPDGAYDAAPADTAVVHAFEHGRVALWFRPDLPARERAQLRAVAEEDSTQLLVVPRRNMPYELAASAWNRDPEPLGTGRLLTCAELTDAAFDAFRAFRDEHRGQGPEPIP